MKKVKIIGTTYGHHVNGRIEPKNRKSEPFYLDDAEADRLVSLGFAEIVEEGVATPSKDKKAANASENTPKVKNRAEDAEIALSDEGEIPYKERPKYNVNTKANELREIGKNIGISFPVGTSKDEMVKQLDAFFDDYFDEALDLIAAEPLA
jgi:hypothetical protein